MHAYQCIHTATIKAIFKNFFMTADECGSRLPAIEQVQSISTPGYPNQYSYNLTCTWTITASSDYLVKLETGFVSNDTCCERLEVSNFVGKMIWIEVTAFASCSLISLLSFRSYHQRAWRCPLMKLTSVRGHRLHLILFPTAAWLEVDLKCNFEQVQLQL